MYSDDDGMMSSGSDRSSSTPAVARGAGATAAAAAAGQAAVRSGSTDEPPVLVESGDDAEEFFHGAVEPTSVPMECVERCAIFMDAALFDPRAARGHENECVVECSMRVVEYPFCQPTAAMPTQTLIYTPQISASNMTKNMRSISVQRWGHMISGQHGIPCTAFGTSTGFEELHKTVRTYQGLMHDYCHTLRAAAKKKSGSGGGGSGSGAAASLGEEASITVALDENELHAKLPDLFWNTVNAAVQVCRAERTPVGVAFLTTEERHEEVCRCLLWLQTQAEISLPRYQVFTLESLLGEAWETLVRAEKENHNCGYHTHLMTNSYGNRRHCCEGTVTTTAKVLEAAVRNL